MTPAIVAAGIVCALALFVVVTLPPRALVLGAPTDGTIPGILHVHTTRSDGRGTPDEVAAAAAQAGLKFVVFTDHGDGTRRPDPPIYRSGVLCLDGVEISTTGGHYIALDMPASPYPLGGEARDVVEDVRRLGGFGIAAHPDSPKPELQWRAWTAPYDAIELLNPDTSWRWRALQGSGGKLRLISALLHYPFRPPETIASLIRESDALPSWHSATSRRRVVAIGGADAHAKLELRNTDPGDNRFTLSVPGYLSLFRTISVHVRTDRPLSGDAGADAVTVMRAIRGGHLYTAIDGVAGPPSFDFTATNALGSVHEGNEIGVSGPVTLHVRTNAPSQFTTIVWSGAHVLGADHHEQEVNVVAPEGPAVYSVSITAAEPSGTVTWLRSNPIYVRGPEELVREAMRPPASGSQPMSGPWRVEHDPGSAGELEDKGGELHLQYRLSGGAASGQNVALVFDTPQGISGADRIGFTVHADRPMRMTLQLRVPDASRRALDRWERSFVAGAFDQDRTIFFDDLTPIGPTPTWRPALPNVRSVMFVIDTVNTKPGTAGRVSIKSISLQR